MMDRIDAGQPKGCYLCSAEPPTQSSGSNILSEKVSRSIQGILWEARAGTDAADVEGGVPDAADVWRRARDK